MNAAPIDRLSKSRYMEGLRCPLAVYLSVHNYELRGDVSPGQQSRFDSGNRVGELARDRYPGGVLMEEDHFHHREAIAATAAALDSGAPAIFEAAFKHDNVKIRADVLRRLDGGGFELIEVKSTGGYRAEKHLPDAGVQLYVLLGNDIDVRRVSIMHLNGDYVWSGGEYDPQQLLIPADITAAAFEYLECVPGHIAEMMETLALPAPPAVAPSSMCSKPYECAFFAWCHKDQPAPDYSGDVTTVPSILDRLDDLRFPLQFVDFETLAPPLPMFVGTSPFQRLRVQWSIHTLNVDGTLEHDEWLCESPTENPDAEFMRTLLKTLRPTGTLVHYSPYERTQMVDIAVRNPEFRQPLVDLVPGFRESLASKLAENGAPFADLRPSPHDGLADFDLGLRIVSRGCVHPTLGPGRYTIKTATKLLARDLPPYEGLAVSDGDQAMVATQEMLDPTTGSDRAAQIRKELLTYCGQDTLAMVEIYRTLMRMRATSE